RRLCRWRGRRKPLQIDSAPQFTHNFKLLCKQGKLELPENRTQWLMDLMPHYLGARYPEDILKLKKRYTQTFCEKLFQETREFFQWLKSVYLK
ncbi:MAG: HEPN domain-containing protein, partial [Deltaproteobacteria bacterium]|nr:HEPN domain-containing protein [Deltaproteobacteria bacterium]